MKQIIQDDQIIRFEETPEMKELVYQKVLEFCLDKGVFCGESVCQCDSIIIALNEFMADLVDNVIKFKVEYPEYQ